MPLPFEQLSFLHAELRVALETQTVGHHLVELVLELEWIGLLQELTEIRNGYLARNTMHVVAVMQQFEGRVEVQEVSLLEEEVARSFHLILLKQIVNVHKVLHVEFYEARIRGQVRQQAPLACRLLRATLLVFFPCAEAQELAPLRADRAEMHGQLHHGERELLAVVRLQRFRQVQEADFQRLLQLLESLQGYLELALFEHRAGT